MENDVTFLPRTLRQTFFEVTHTFLPLALRLHLRTDLEQRFLPFTVLHVLIAQVFLPLRPLRHETERHTRLPCLLRLHVVDTFLHSLRPFTFLHFRRETAQTRLPLTT